MKMSKKKYRLPNYSKASKSTTWRRRKKKRRKSRSRPHKTKWEEVKQEK